MITLPSDAYRPNLDASRSACADADRALEKGDLDTATRSAARAILADPGWHRGYHVAASVLERRGLLEAAVSAYRGLLTEDGAALLFGTRKEPAENSGEPVFTRHAVHDVERIDIPPRANVPAAEEEGFSRIVAPPSFVDHVRDGYVWQDFNNTLVLDGERREISDHTHRSSEVVRRLICEHPPARINGRLIVLGAPGSGNYYHWMTDILPKLQLLDEIGFQPNPDDRYLVPLVRSKFHTDTLAHLGIAASQVVATRDCTPWVRATDVFVPRLRNNMGMGMARWVPKFLQKRFRSRHETEDSRATRHARRILVLRDTRASQGRGLENESVVVAALAAFGFEPLFPERLSVIEQADAFHAADVVLAPHGAGLTNIVHCKPGTKVLEFHGLHIAPCYEAISALLQLPYFRYACVKFEEDDLISRERTLPERRSASFGIPIDILHRALADADIGKDHVPRHDS